MKPQDIIFLVVFLILLFKFNRLWALIVGLVCLALSIPLFAKHIFFTAEHLTWYGIAYIFLAMIITAKQLIYENRH